MLISTENFKNKEKAGFKLNILVLENEIIAIVINNLSNEIEAFDKVGQLSDLEVKQSNFSDVKIITVNGLFTLVPQGIFDEKKVASYLNFSTEMLDSSEIKFTKNESFSLNTVWHLKKELKDEITSYWPGCSFSHFMAHRLNYTNENNANNTLFIDLLSGSISILLFTNRKLQIANHFLTNGDEDALYYLLLTLEQSNVKTEDLTVILSGTNSFEKKIKQYFKNISLNKTKYKCSLQITEEDQISCSVL